MDISIFEFELVGNKTQCLTLLKSACEYLGYIETYDENQTILVGRWNWYGHQNSARISVATCAFIFVEEQDEKCFFKAIVAGPIDAFSRKIVFNRLKKRIKKTTGNKINARETQGVIRNISSLKNFSKSLNTSYMCYEEKQIDDLKKGLHNSISFLDILDVVNMFLPEIDKPQQKKKSHYAYKEEEDNSLHFDEDPDMHDVDEDGYCLECDEFEDDMR